MKPYSLQSETNVIIGYYQKLYAKQERPTRAKFEVKVFLDVTLCLGKYLLMFGRITVHSSSVSILLRPLDREDEGTAVLQNVENYSPNDKVSLP